MSKQLQITSIIILAMILVVSCAPKLTPTPPAAEEPEVEVPEEVPATGEASVDEVATDISDASTTDDELDTSDLDDVESILTDIENI